MEEYVLPVAFDLPPALHVERDGADYLATVEVYAVSASEALKAGSRLFGIYWRALPLAAHRIGLSTTPVATYS
ncbi:MAG: hypothetical protein WAK86_18875, partial [Pseudonocardiaceae bacterium]